MAFSNVVCYLNYSRKKSFCYTFPKSCLPEWRMRHFRKSITDNSFCRFFECSLRLAHTNNQSISQFGIHVVFLEKPWIHVEEESSGIDESECQCWFFFTSLFKDFFYNENRHLCMTDNRIMKFIYVSKIWSIQWRKSIEKHSFYGGHYFQNSTSNFFYRKKLLQYP